MKRCSKCRIEKVEKCFHKDKYTPDKLTYQCIQCIKERDKKYRDNNPLTDAQRQRNKIYQKQWNERRKSRQS